MSHKKVLEFPKERIVRVHLIGDHPQRAKEFSHHWRLTDLGGKRPEGHPEVARGRRGGVILNEHQVWVRIYDDLLWVVIAISENEHSGTYHRRVWLRPYKSRDRQEEIELSEQSLRAMMKVWDDIIPLKKEMMEKLHRICGEKIDKALRYFGIDERGDRVD